MAVRIPIGDDRNINIYYKDERGKPANLTGATVSYVIVPTDSYTDTPLLTKTTTTYETYSGATNNLDSTGVATVTITSANTESLTAGSYYSFAKVVDSQGRETKSLKGDFIIE